ncbi:MAG: hypothetical protein ACXAEU_02145 [Candidatus Hodarchaeales archaeon]
MTSVLSAIAQLDPAQLVIIGLAGLGGVVVAFLLYYFRDYIPLFRRSPKKEFFEQQIDELLAQIRQKSRQQQFKAASFDVWRTFNLSSYGYLDITRGTHQTARQFGLSFLQFDNIDQETVMSVVELFEHARYGESPLSQAEFNKGLNGLHQFLQAAQHISRMVQTRGKAGEAVEYEEEAAVAYE